MHARSFFRDIKPENILLDVYTQPIVADFGISGQEPTGNIAIGGHEESDTIGTYGYQAPECRNMGYFSVRSDVYAFGVMTLQMLTAR